MQNEIGGKARGLIALREHKLSVPAFFEFDFLALQEPEKFDEIIADWVRKNAIAPDTLWAVRSSAGQEDGAAKSFAGQYTTVLNQRPHQLADALRKVVESYGQKTDYSETANSYGAIIQKMLLPDYSGVFFSRDPARPYRNEPVITLVPGMGEKLVSGEFTGYTINFKNEEALFENTDQIISGERFNGKEKETISAEAQEIKAAIQPHISAMLATAKKLESVYNAALDFEFALQNGQLFWLQMRPITTRNLAPVCVVWDNTPIEANFPDTTLPLSISFNRRTYNKAYSFGGQALGFSKIILKQTSAYLQNMCGEIDGGFYYNVSAWQHLLYQLPMGKKLSHMLPKIWGATEAPFSPPKLRHSLFFRGKIALQLILKSMRFGHYDKLYMAGYTQFVTDFDGQKSKAKSLQELIADYEKLERELCQNWIAPLVNGLFTVSFFSLLKRSVSRSKLATEYPNFVNDILFAEGEVISVQLVRNFQDLLSTIYADEKLKSIFATLPADEILPRLAAENPAFHQRILAHIAQFGNRTDQAELKMETVTYQHQPELFIAFLVANLSGYVPRKSKQSKFDFEKIIHANYRNNPLKKWFFICLIKRVIYRVKARENYRFMRTNTYAVARNMFMDMGENLHRQKAIENPRDIFYLEMEELLNPKIAADFKALISSRKAAYKTYETQTRPNRYMQCDGKMIAVFEDELAAGKDELKGTGCCSGVVTARVKVIDKNTNFDQDFSDYILIAHYFEPGWISLFYQAKGIISERGNLISHTAIICRELNVPSIVGATGLLKMLKNDDEITMNGMTGTLKINALEAI